MGKYTGQFLKDFKLRYSAEPEFLQSVKETVSSLDELFENRKDLADANILERLCEPERVLQFRVVWADDNGGVQVNRGYRVQFNSALGPYKGGLRFHPSVNLSILKFLAFEQILKNSLTGMWLGAGKGGSDFDPKDKSDGEVMRFCQAFMAKLANHIGPNTDVPAGDIGVGAREIGYLFGAYKSVTNRFEGSITGKGLDWGGSRLRPEATGYGLIYFVEAMLNHSDVDIAGKSIVISGSGNVSQYAAEKALEKGAKVLTVSDSNGYVYDQNGIDTDKLEFIKHLKNVKRGRIKEFAEQYRLEYQENQKPWQVKADIYLPCATQNEISGEDAKTIAGNDPIAVAEGANMPSTTEAIECFRQNNIMFGPAKASNAGGVAVSGLEMAQNSAWSKWTAEEVDDRLKEIMKDIHTKCVEYGGGGSSVDYLKGANLGGFIRVAEAMLIQGTT